MQIYFFTETGFLEKTGLKTAEIRRTFAAIADGTDTTDLVVAVYLVKKSVFSGGTAYARNWLTPTAFSTGRGRWKLSRLFPVPAELPEKFKLIRLLPKWQHFPGSISDIYGWTFSYQSFTDHLALVFAHELHHFRRYHLGEHPREGEHGANLWALKRVGEIGLSVTGERVKVLRKRKKSPLFRKKDQFVGFRKLNTGDSVYISHDPRSKYVDQQAVVQRPIRKNSKRLVIQTADKKNWRWPMQWLEIIEE